MYKLQSNNNKHNNYITIEYVNDLIDKIKFNDILHSVDSCNSIPVKRTRYFRC